MATTSTFSHTQAKPAQHRAYPARARATAWACSLMLGSLAHAEGPAADPKPAETEATTLPQAPLVPPPVLELSADEVGLASWYGPRFHRRRTASGELFDMKALTAAHPTLPFGSHVCVRSQITGRSVVVRINDRGPYTGNRVIDLSRGAAEVLGMVGLGLKPVELFALQEGTRTCPAP